MVYIYICLIYSSPIKFTIPLIVNDNNILQRFLNFFSVWKKKNITKGFARYIYSLLPLFFLFSSSEQCFTEEEQERKMLGAAPRRKSYLETLGLAEKFQPNLLLVDEGTLSLWLSYLYFFLKKRSLL